MTSKAYTDLHVALADVDALIIHAKSFSGGKQGAPAAVDGVKRPGRPFTHAAVVMLAGATEAFFESLAGETLERLQLTSDQSKDVKNLIKSMHGIGPDKVHGLYAALGLPFILDGLGWKGLPKGTARSRVAELHTKRNKIAHGKAPSAAQVKDVTKDRQFVESLAAAMEKATASRITQISGGKFIW